MCAPIIRAKYYEITLGLSPNYIRVHIARLGFLYIEIFVYTNPLGDQIKQ